MMYNKADALLGFQQDFWRLMKDQGIRNPFVEERENFSKHVRHNEDGSMSVDLNSFRERNKVTRAEKDAWIIAEEEYIAERSFYEIGYEEFFWRTREKDYYSINHLRGLDKFVPCRAKDGQCMLTCKNFGGDCDVLANITEA